MKVFISWSGEKSKAVASKLRDWLPDVIQTVEPWMSKHDIEAGARWGKEVAGELSDTKFGIICLTRENLAAPWILFEAGALSKTVNDTYVCPYLIDLEPADIPASPLTQFQAKRANKDETFELVKTINSALKENALPEERLRRTFERSWGDLQSVLNTLPEDKMTIEKRPIQDMVAEILEVVRILYRQEEIPRTQKLETVSTTPNSDLIAKIISSGLIKVPIPESFKSENTVKSPTQITPRSHRRRRKT